MVSARKLYVEFKFCWYLSHIDPVSQKAQVKIMGFLK